MKKLSVYVHIPFCVKKCDYCDFLSAPADEDTKTKYVDRLLEEIEKEAENYREYEVVSVFFGGGTPSVLKKEDNFAFSTSLILYEPYFQKNILQCLINTKSIYALMSSLF